MEELPDHLASTRSFCLACIVRRRKCLADGWGSKRDHSFCVAPFFKPLGRLARQQNHRSEPRSSAHVKFHFARR